MKFRLLPSDQNGAALVEFAIVAPFLILLVIGLIEVGRYANFAVLVGDASRAGAQYGAQNIVTAAQTAQPPAEGMVKAALNDGENTSGMSAVASNFCQCADGSASTCQPTDCPLSHRILWVKVTTTGNFTSLMQYPGIPNTFNVVQTATRRVAQ